MCHKSIKQPYLAPWVISDKIPECAVMCSSGNLETDPDLNEKFGEFDEFDW